MRTRTPGGDSTSSFGAVPSPAADLRRRRFLVSLGAGGAAAAAATVASLPGIEADAEAPPDAGGSGYSQTKHVRDYYRTVKV
jgi:hypothetical protein